MHTKDSSSGDCAASRATAQRRERPAFELPGDVRPAGGFKPRPRSCRQWGMGRTLLISVLTVVLLGCSTSSDPSPAAVNTVGEHARVPNMIGVPFDVAVERLDDNGLCVDRVEVLPPRRTDDPSRLTPGLILLQQPGPTRAGRLPVSDHPRDLRRQADLGARSSWDAVSVRIRWSSGPVGRARPTPGGPVSQDDRGALDRRFGLGHRRARPGFADQPKILTTPFKKA